MTDTSGHTAPKVGIVGFAQGHLAEAPFGVEGWEVWGINRLHTMHPGPYHRYFNLHDLERFHGEDHEHLKFLKEFPGPVYLRPQDIGKYDIPNQVPFPVDALVKKYQRFAYFNNTISWLLAFALENPDLTDLAVTGVDMAQDSVINAEFSSQKPSCEFFLGIALGRGVTLHIPAGSDLLNATHLYGFEDSDPVYMKYQNRLQELGERKNQLKQQMANGEAQIQAMRDGVNQLDGAMQDVQFWLRNWLPLNPGEPFKSEASPNEGVDSGHVELVEEIAQPTP